MKSNLAKFSVFLFLLYLFWYKEAIAESSSFLYGGALLVIGSTMWYMNKQSYNRFGIPFGVKWHIAFGIYSLVFGFFIVEYKFYMITSLITYFAFMTVAMCICYICEGERDISWLMREVAVIAIICALYTATKGVEVYNIVMVKVMSEWNNPNTLGVMLMFGIFAVTMLNNRKFSGMLMSFPIMALLVYVIVLTGSRKSLFSAGILVIIWLAFFVKDVSASGKFGKIVFTYLIVFAVAVIAVRYFKTSYMNTASFDRVTMLFENGGMTKRGNMYAVAWRLFKQNPLFGVGYNQYRIVSGLNAYSHSTYAEVLASGGIMGTFIYFFPILAAGVSLLKNTIRRKSYVYGVILALYCTELFLGAGNIFMYDPVHIFMWTILFMFADKRNLTE